MAGPTIEIRVQDGDEENSVIVPLKDMSRRWIDAHRMRHDWVDDEPLATVAINYLRSMAHDDLIPRSLPDCTVVIALALLCEVVGEKELARICAALTVPDTVLEMRLALWEMPVCRITLAEIGSAARH